MRTARSDLAPAVLSSAVAGPGCGRISTVASLGQRLLSTAASLPPVWSHPGDKPHRVVLYAPSPAKSSRICQAGCSQQAACDEDTILRAS